jgi:hypothetical protein
MRLLGGGNRRVAALSIVGFGAAIALVAIGGVGALIARLLGA